VRAQDHVRGAADRENVGASPRTCVSDWNELHLKLPLGQIVAQEPSATAFVAGHGFNIDQRPREFEKLHHQNVSPIPRQ